MRLARHLLRLARDLAQDRRGVAMIEFAAVLPLLVTMFFGCFELARYSLANLKIDRVAGSAGDLVAQLSVVTAAELTDIFDASQQIMDPFTLGAAGKVIISEVYRPGTAAATISWQRSGGGTLAEASRIGSAGQTPTQLPGNITVPQNGGEIIVAESFYRYTPTLAGNLFGSTTFYRVHVFRPRCSTCTLNSVQ